MNKKIVVGITVLIIVSLMLAMSIKGQPNKTDITNFKECEAAGYPIAESYPRQCTTDDKVTFVEEIEDLPQTTEEITITGEVTCLPKRGNGPQTMECAIGLAGDDGKNYGLKNLNEFDSEYRLSQTGKRIKVSGVLSTDKILGPDGNQYDVEGVITVTAAEESKK